MIRSGEPSHPVVSDRGGFLHAIPRAVDDLVSAIASYVELPDYGAVAFGAGVAVTAHMDGDPTWGLVVDAPSTGKTELIRAFDGVVDEPMDEITPAGLLSWSRGRKPEPVGLLARHPGRCFGSIADLSTVLASSDRGCRDELFSLLRRAYDGSVKRDHNVGPLRWDGRLTLLAAVTPTVDNYASHSDALGPRWVYYRLPSLDDEQRRRASRAARANEEEIEAYRSTSRKAAVRAVHAAVSRLGFVDVSEWLGDQIDDATEVACLGRAAVARSGYGRQEIIALPIVEGPARLAGQLHRLARALLALGLAEGEAAALVRRCALDSMPRPRRILLDVLAGGDSLTVAAIARQASMNRGVARRALEELQAIGVTTFDGTAGGSDDDDSEPTRKPWRLEDDRVPLISRVISAAQCSEKGGYYPIPPSNRNGDPSPHFRSPVSGSEETDAAGGGTL